MRPWLRVVLVLSLALNLVVIGGVTGLALRFGRSGPPPLFAEGPGSPMILALSHGHRKAIGRSIRQAHQERSGAARGRAGYYLDLVALLEAEPLDLEALREAGAGLDARSALHRELARDVWLDQVARMSTDERRAYAGRMRAIVSRAKPPRRDAE